LLTLFSLLVFFHYHYFHYILRHIIITISLLPFSLLLLLRHAFIIIIDKRSLYNGIYTTTEPTKTGPGLENKAQVYWPRGADRERWWREAAWQVPLRVHTY
jgi:hypothetical protein